MIQKHYVYKALTQFEKERPDTKIEVISGMASGADACAAEWAIDNEFNLHGYPAQWRRFGKSAGFIRNQQMLDIGKPDVVIAFPGGNGTAHMVMIAKEAGVKIIEVENESSALQTGEV